MVFIATQFTVLRIVGERAPYGTLDRDLLAISRAGMYLGKFLAGVVIVVIQSFLFLAVGKIAYNMTMEGSFYLSFVFLFFVSLTGLAIGLFFSVIAKTKEQAVQLVPFTILIFLVLSGDLIPLRDMPSFLKQIAASSPITLANEGLRKVMLEGKSFNEVSNHVMKLLGWIDSMLIFGIVKFITEKK
jgi:ABC-2 type transport system permease protein